MSISTLVAFVSSRASSTGSRRLMRHFLLSSILGPTTSLPSDRTQQSRPPLPTPPSCRGARPSHTTATHPLHTCPLYFARSGKGRWHSIFRALSTDKKKGGLCTVPYGPNSHFVTSL